MLALTFVIVAPAFADDAKTVAQRLDEKWLEAWMRLPSPICTQQTRSYCRKVSINPARRCFSQRSQRSTA